MHSDTRLNSCCRKCVAAGPRGCISLALWGSFVLALFLTPMSVFGQGQDSQTSATGGQARGHPPPLSSASATAAPSGTPVEAFRLPAEYYRQDSGGLSWPGLIRIPSSASLVCDEIRDATARARCASRSAASAPPKGGPE
jgi:hypothetical protein